MTTLPPLTPAQMRAQAHDLENEAKRLEELAADLQPRPCRCPSRCYRSCPSRIAHVESVASYQVRAENLRDEAIELRTLADRAAARVPLRAKLRQVFARSRQAEAENFRRLEAEQRRSVETETDPWWRESRLQSAATYADLAAESERVAAKWAAA